MHRLLFIFFFFSLFHFLSAQENVVSDNEKQLAGLFDSLQTDASDEKKKELNDTIFTLLAKELRENENSFNELYPTLKFVGKVFSDDKKVKIYTWNFQFSDKTYGYGGFIQYKENNKKMRLVPLVVKEEAYLPTDNKSIALNNWYGALYYRIIPIKQRKETYYVLLGWAGNNAASDFKLIDFLSLKENQIHLGKPALQQKNKMLQRFVLEYNADVTVSLAYDEKSKKIIFDHLIPIDPSYKGIYSFYGPDFTYDAFALKKEGWIFEENVDVKNKE